MTAVFVAAPISDDAVTKLLVVRPELALDG